MFCNKLLVFWNIFIISLEIFPLYKYSFVSKNILVIQIVKSVVILEILNSQEYICQLVGKFPKITSCHNVSRVSFGKIG
ncbi:MAG: hypothetical protein Q8S84_02400 [bacterium]|nr:hypothetical protein [bacterium]MDP3380402.1 hypothetical protein [bacterium]